MLVINSASTNVMKSLIGSLRSFARMTGSAGRMQHFRYGVAKTRGRWYYRYHKPIGKANWKGYQERYIRPKDVEAKQRLVFAPRATTKQHKQSISWEWRLPKLLAQATTPNQVLDAWILFRYRQPKRVCHYMMTLRRLVEVGGCEQTDWRLQVLISRFRKSYKRVINHDILLRYLSDLRLYKEMELLTRFLKPRIPLMKSNQLVSVMKSFGNCRLRDAAIAGACRRYIRKDMQTLSSDDLISVISSTGEMELRNSNFVEEILLGILKRPLTLNQFQSLLAATRSAKVRDYTLIELAADACHRALEEGHDHANVCLVIRELSLLGVTETKLFKDAVNKVDPLRVRLKSVIALVRSTAECVGNPVLLQKHLNLIRMSIGAIRTHGDLVDVAKAVDTVFDSVHDGQEFLTHLASHLVTLSRDLTRYDVPELADILSRRGVHSPTVWKVLMSDTQFAIQDFEPQDFLKAAKVFAALPADVLGAKRTVMANDLAEWSLKRWEEFETADWEMLRSLLTRPADQFTANEWCRGQFHKWGTVLRNNRPIA